MKRKKKESAIPDFWLDDGPMPSDSTTYDAEHASAEDNSGEGDWVRSRLSGMRKREAVDEKPIPRGLANAIDRPQRGESVGFAVVPKSELMAASRQQTEAPQKSTKKMSRRQRKLERQQQQQTKGDRLRKASTLAEPTPSGGQPAISINVQLPHLGSVKEKVRAATAGIRQRMPELSRKQWVVMASIAGILLLAVVSGIFVTRNHKPSGGDVAGAQAPGINFKPLVPIKVAGGGEAQLKVDNQKHIVSFQDTFAQTQIVVTQQNLPENIKKDSGAYTALLSNFGVDQAKPIDTAIGKLYLATKTNPAGSKQQFAILKLEDSLLFMSAKRELATETWQDYLSSLHIKDN